MTLVAQCASEKIENLDLHPHRYTIENVLAFSSTKKVLHVLEFDKIKRVTTRSDVVAFKLNILLRTSHWATNFKVDI